MFNYPTPEVIAAWGAVIAAVAAVIFKIWRSSYSTDLGNKKDIIEGASLQLVYDQLKKQNEELRIERDQYREEAKIAWTQRIEDAKKIAALETENSNLKIKIMEIAEQVQEIRKAVNKDANAITQT